MSRNSRVAPLAVVLPLFLATSVRSAPKTEKTLAEKLREPISISLRESPAIEVFEALASILGIKASIDGGVDGPVTVELHHVSIGTVLDAICESIQSSWTIEQQNELRVHPPSAADPARPRPPAGAWDRPLSLSLAGAPIGDVVASSAHILGVPIAVAPELAGETVTIELENVPARDGLEQISEQVGAELTEIAGSPPLYRLIKAVDR
jgi:type II secretory pathway component GspD/PulD (secretin)